MFITQNWNGGRTYNCYLATVIADETRLVYPEAVFDLAFQY